MRKKFIGSLLLAAAVIIGTSINTTVVYAGDAAQENAEDSEDTKVTQASGQTFIDMIMEGAPEGTWEDVEEVTPGSLGDGIFLIEAHLTDESGQARISSPVTVNISGGIARALIAWESDRYEYMNVNGIEYLPLEKEKVSTFEIQVELFNMDLELITGGTKEDGTVWEEQYVLRFDLNTIEKDGMNPRIFGMILGVIIGIACVFIVIKLDILHDKKKAVSKAGTAVKNTNKYRK